MMRLHCDREVMRVLRALGEEGAPIRRRIEGLLQNPLPTDARGLPGRFGVYEFFEAGYWIDYKIDRSDPGETVIFILLVEAN